MEDKKYVLWLSRIKKIGLHTKLKLLKCFKTGNAIFLATENELINSKVLNLDLIKIVMSYQDENYINNYLEELASMRISYSTINCEDYPHLLKNIVSPPMVLYYLGTLPNHNDTLVSIIGTRRPSMYGKNVTAKLSSDLAKHGVTIVSGMARGIDTLASLSAIDGNGKTIAVLGSSVDICYPPENKDVMKKIINNGCVISEFPPKTKPHPAYFPMRNRIISGLSQATLVIEATVQSGTLITVDHALEQGRDVFAVPGNITSKQSEGTNNLIKDGAMSVTSFIDVINLLQIDNSSINMDNSNQNKTTDNFTDEEQCVYNFISDEAIFFEDLMNRAKISVPDLQHILTMLEIKGAIKKLPGQQFIRSFNGGN